MQITLFLFPIISFRINTPFEPLTDLKINQLSCHLIRPARVVVEVLAIPELGLVGFLRFDIQRLVARNGCGH